MAIAAGTQSDEAQTDERDGDTERTNTERSLLDVYRVGRIGQVYGATPVAADRRSGRTARLTQGGGRSDVRLNEPELAAASVERGRVDLVAGVAPPCALRRSRKIPRGRTRQRAKVEEQMRAVKSTRDAGPSVTQRRESAPSLAHTRALQAAAVRQDRQGTRSRVGVFDRSFSPLLQALPCSVCAVRPPDTDADRAVGLISRPARSSESVETLLRPSHRSRSLLAPWAEAGERSPA